MMGTTGRTDRLAYMACIGLDAFGGFIQRNTPIAASREHDFRKNCFERAWNPDWNMQAIDIMTRNAETVSPDMTVKDVARILLRRHTSAVPVVDDDGVLLGIVSEGDLMRRSENDTERKSS
jgi:signal-transduction protein with cAMP-binding, CBS, and nucleotidyltransferase domain